MYCLGDRQDEIEGVHVTEYRIYGIGDAFRQWVVACVRQKTKTIGDGSEEEDQKYCYVDKIRHTACEFRIQKNT